jgi:hypothetical protein
MLQLVNHLADDGVDALLAGAERKEAGRKEG